MPFADDYVDVATRITQFRDRFPDGCLRPADPKNPIKIRELPGGQVFLEYTALAYRTPDDQRPGIGIAWEPYPGQTSFTRNSEAMNAETSAWGRAIVAALAGDSRHVASREEVRARQQSTLPNLTALDEAVTMLVCSSNREELVTAWNFAGQNHLFDTEVPGEGQTYRKLWKQQLDIVDGLGQEQGPPVVAPEDTDTSAAEEVLRDTLGAEAAP